MSDDKTIDGSYDRHNRHRPIKMFFSFPSQLLYCIKFHEEPKNLAKELENVMPQLTNLFRFLLHKSNCAVIRTTVLEVSLALTKQGLLSKGGLESPKPAKYDEIWSAQEEKIHSQLSILSSKNPR